MGAFFADQTRSLRTPRQMLCSQPDIVLLASDFRSPACCLRVCHILDFDFADCLGVASALGLSFDSFDRVIDLLVSVSVVP
jgi:hypothetical protein